MAWAGYSCFTPDFALIEEDLLCSTPVWKQWEHPSVPEAAGEHPTPRTKPFLQPWRKQLQQATAHRETNLAASPCAKASPMGAATERRELPIMDHANSSWAPDWLQMVLDVCSRPEMDSH